MDYFNEWSFKRLADLLDDKLPHIDKPSYILATFLPIAELQPAADTFEVIVSMEVIAGLCGLDTANAAMEILVKASFAKWHTENRKRVGIVIGSSTNGLTMKLKNPPKEKRSKYRKSVVAMHKDVREALSTDVTKSCPHTVKLLDSNMEKYRDFCTRMRLRSTPDDVERAIKDYIDAAEVGRVNSDVLLSYLGAVNCMVYDEMQLTIFSGHKERAVANKILAKATPTELFEIVPEFVLRYPDMARGDFKDTNVFNLSFHLMTFKMKLGKRVSKRVKYDESDTL